MPDFTINHPKESDTVKLKNLPGTIGASGRADDSLTLISATCEYRKPPDPATHPAQCTWIATFQGKKKHPSDAPYKRWIIGIRAPEEGDYRVTVTATFADRSTATKRHNFRIRKRPHTTATQGKPSYGHAPIIDFVTISYAGSGENVDSNDFTPYGELTPDDLKSVTLTEKGTTTQINQLFLFSDPVDLQFWCVQFDVLTVNSLYTLIATDNGNNSETSDDLKAV